MVAESEGVVGRLVCDALTIYWLILLAYVVLGWLQVAGLRRPYDGPGRVAFDVLDRLVLPVVRPLDRMIPPARFGGMGISWGVLIAFVIVVVLQRAFC